ncbi:retrovirus-related Pol polyprotein from transposon TNT 1-94 [Trichonephila clavipes]|uniref:Retrovirus-related Pol polyprotein from transposon TNT 1-94 n=1 Tax=Trichonephila clavipes TaxID=2585209 RepID=A0A8X6VMK5_TRICX|nr:retrovirus-related Pol polyprotein from transposon TNT 1-94 [Trichonephila clavipes]
MEKSPQQESWRRAMDEEFHNLKLRNVWKLTKLPPDKQLLGCRWVYNLKRDENGKVINYKARLVAQCYSQVKGRTRPYVSYAVSIFSQFQNDPGLEHWYGLLKLFGYVNKTKPYKLRLDCRCINIVGFSDADFAANRDDRISMGGQFICLGNAPVTWRKFKKKSVSLSTMEAEFISRVECIKKITWLDNIMNECANRDLVKYANKPVLLADNQAAINFLKSPIENYRTKHIEEYIVIIQIINTVQLCCHVVVANNTTVRPTQYTRSWALSDEAPFWLNGYVNKQNCRIWSEANPQVYVETPLHPEKLTVWCALWAGGIIGPYFKNDEGHKVTVNGDWYRAMITNFFIPELNNYDVQEPWFQQDGATCHTARATIDLLKDTFGDRQISRFGPVNWPPRSCDLTPLDYFCVAM